MRRGYEKVCMAVAVLAMSLSLSACGMDSLVDALGTSGKSQETAGETQEATGESQGAAAESQEAFGETQEEPEESQGAAADSQEVPERGENTPLHPLVQEQYLSDYDDSFRQLAYTEYASVGIRCADEKYARTNTWSISAIVNRGLPEVTLSPASTYLVSTVPSIGGHILHLSRLSSIWAIWTSIVLISHRILSLFCR